MRRVVITGMGVVSPIGNDLKSYEDALFSGKNGIDLIKQFDATDFKVKVAGEVKNLNPENQLDRGQLRKMDPFTIFAMVASDQALEQSGLMAHADPNRVGVIIGSGIGGIHAFEKNHRALLEGGPRKVSPFFVPMMILDIVTGHVSIRHGLKGPNYSVVSACATASQSIGDAHRMISYGDADAVVAGGCEGSVTPAAIAGFQNMKALSTNPDPETVCRPFDKDRNGFVMGEGAGIVVLEEMEHAKNRGAKILGELVGYGATGDAFHITAPAEGGEGAVRAMRRAIEDAGISPEQVGYINAHGTSTNRNDKTETTAIRTVYGKHADDLIVSSTKSMTGHLLGAAGGVEAIATLIALNRQEVPPTINYKTPDPECDLNYSPNKSTKLEFEYGMSNTFGFGGHNAVLLIKRHQD